MKIKLLSAIVIAVALQACGGSSGGGTPEASPTATPAVSPTPTTVPDPSPTATPAASPTATPTATPAASPTATPTATPEASPTATPTATPEASPTATPTATPEASPSPEVTPTPVASPTPMASPDPGNGALVGSWVLEPVAGSMGVGATPGAIDWWSLDEAGITARACFMDDVYTFTAEGDYTIDLQSETWLEAWQLEPGDLCGTPVSPHDGNGVYAYVYDDVAGTVTIEGQGGYIVLPKATNSGELGGGLEVAPPSVTYDVPTATTDQLVIQINTDEANGGDVWWTFILVPAP